MSWLLDETEYLDSDAMASIISTQRLERSTTRGGDAKAGVPLAVRLNDVVIHDAKKWFGGADIRLDAIVVNGAQPDIGNFYQPATFRFPGVRDGDRLPIEAPGLLFFYGRPKHFLDISIMVSRDRKDSQDLSALIKDRVGSSEWSIAAKALLSLATAAPQAAVVTAAIAGAISIGNYACEVLGQITSATVGLYRTTWLQGRDRFGLGRHPQTGSFRQKDLEFWYQIVADLPKKHRALPGR